MTTVIVIVVIALLLFAALRLWITANRLDRLHVRTEAAWSALEGALARRIVATRAVAAAGGLGHPQSDELRRLADIADNAERAHRADAENDLSRALATVSAASAPDLALELADAGERVTLARRFYNDAVRDTRALRAVLFTRVFGLAGRAALPDYFEIVEHGPAKGRIEGEARTSRTAARVVVFDAADRVLLLSGTDPQVGSLWWHTPGGGVESGEDLRSTARRELAEETGFLLDDNDLVGPIWRRVALFTFLGVDYQQTELYFTARAPSAGGPAASGPINGVLVDGSATREAHTGSTLTDGTSAPAPAGDGQRRPVHAPGAILLAAPPVDVSGHTDLERLTLIGHRWWTPQELAGTDQDVYPVELASRLPQALHALRSGVAGEPVPEVQ